MTVNSKSIIVGVLFILNAGLIHANSTKNKFKRNVSEQYNLQVFNDFASKDTSVFTLARSNGIKVLSFDNDNILSLPACGLKLIVKEELGDFYTLQVKIRNKIVLTKKRIKGISRVLLDKDYLLFSVFTYLDEDGNNEGNGYVLNLSSKTVRAFSKQLKNTCNPLIMDNYAYFIDGLNLVKTDLNIKGNFKIAY